MSALTSSMATMRNDTDVALPWQQLRHAAAQPAPWLALAQAYARDGLPWQAGYAARQALRADASLLPTLQRLDIAPWRDAAAGDGLLGRPSLAQAGTMARRLHARLRASPGDWLTWLYLARLLEMPGASDDAPMSPVAHTAVDKAKDKSVSSAVDSTVDNTADNTADDTLPTAQRALEQAMALEPIPGESLHWMGVWRLHAGAPDRAVAALSALLDIRPMRHGSMMYLGEALLRIGNVNAAEKAFARASMSTNCDFLLALAARVHAHNYWQEAIAVVQKACAIKPDDVSILLTLAKMQSEVYALADCRATLSRALTIDPASQEARLLEAGLLGRMGDARGHLDTLQRAYAAAGDPLSRMASSIAMTSLYQDCATPAQVTAIADLHRRLCAPIEAAAIEKTDFVNPRTLGMMARVCTATTGMTGMTETTPGRRLRIGCVTGDLHRQHPVNIFMLPVLQRLDHARLEICIYHTGTTHDDYTRQARNCADRWLDAALLDDAALQAAIVADKIDILIDLAGHTATHRLGVFALRAAPVQATFLGYPHSTGLSRIDWIIGDATVTPSDHTHLFSEGLAQMPDSVFCWAPVDDYPLPPARAAGAPKVFGSFNNAMKLSPRTIALWARILHAVPDSLLLLKAPSLGDATVQARFAGLFAEQGIAADRLLFRGPSGLASMMQAYGEIDVALDPTPYNGGTTTLQAMWMGLPVVTLEGQNFATRMGASFMQTLGQPEWIASDEAAYVQTAVRLMNEHASLRTQRALLRAQMAASPLCDIEQYVRAFDGLLQRMWAVHCAGDGQRVIAGMHHDTIELTNVPPYHREAATGLSATSVSNL